MLDLDAIKEVLKKCGGYAPDKTPAVSEMVVAAWFENLNSQRICREEALWAVSEYFKQPHDRLVQPADISLIARASRRDYLDRTHGLEGDRAKRAWNEYIARLGFGPNNVRALPHAQ